MGTCVSKSRTAEPIAHAGEECLGVPVPNNVTPSFAPATKQVAEEDNPFRRVKNQSGRIMQAGAIWEDSRNYPLDKQNEARVYLLDRTSIWIENS